MRPENTDNYQFRWVKIGLNNTPWLVFFACFIFLLGITSLCLAGCAEQGSAEPLDVSDENEREIYLPEKPEVKVSDKAPVLGDPLEIKLKNVKKLSDLTLETNFEGDTTRVFFQEGTLRVIKGIDYYNAVGEYTIYLKVTGKAGNTWNEKLDIEILAGNFQEQEFSVAIEAPEEWTEENLKKQRELVEASRQDTAKEPLWAGEFIWPLDGDITSEFGAVRIINQGEPNRHSGIDIAESTGTSIKAANSGRVRLAEPLVSMGKTVIIDHGVGITSEYLHMDEIYVEAGEKVSKGEIIGEVGETGFATGPHLHWQIYIDETPVNPAWFLKEDSD